MPLDAIPGRLGLLLTTFLCQINTFNSVARTTPKSSGEATAIVFWITACMCFILLALAEYFLILLLNQEHLMLKDRHNARKHSDKTRQEKSNYDIAKRIDKLMLIACPPFFILFSIVFWHAA